MSGRSVAVCTVTWNAEADLPGFLEAVANLDHRPLELVAADCGSADRSAELLRGATPAGIAVKVLELGENRGFSGGMNAAVAATDADAILSLNPDTRPEPDYARRLVAHLEDPRVGAVTGRLVREARPPGGAARLDACGMFLTPTWRHLDRGSGEEDDGRYAVPERVFGGTGAATLYRREALLDVAVDGDVFDPDFHSYREDAELAFRLQERGWEAIYEPGAVCVHRRRVTPERRSEVPAVVNYHSVKNRFLLRAYHQTGRNAVWTLVPTLGRDLAAMVWILGIEHGSLPALTWLWRHRKRIRERRRRIQGRRTAPPAALDRWFVRRSLPLEDGR